jgi:hypothetical protein
MRNYRVLLDKKVNEYYVQGQGKLTKIWLPITKYKKGDYLLNIKTYIHFIAVFAALFLNYFVTDDPTLLGIIAILYDFFFLIYAIIWLVFIRENHFNKRYFCDEKSAKNFIKEKLHEENKARELKETGRNIIVGIMIDGEYVDGEKLRRWKKLERIVGDKKK